MDEVSDGERNSEDGTEMGEGDEPGEGAMDVDDLWGNDKGESTTGVCERHGDLCWAEELIL